MSLIARAKATRGLGYSPLMRATQGLLAVAVQPPEPPPTSYMSPWANSNIHQRSPNKLTHLPRRTRSRREAEFFLVNH